MTKYPFSVARTEVEGHAFWVARSIHLKGCVGQGDLQKEAIDELEENEKAWLETAKETDIPIPKIATERVEEYSYVVRGVPL